MTSADLEQFKSMQRSLYKKLRISGANHLQALLVCFADGLTPFELASLFADPGVKPDSIRRKADRIKDDLASIRVLEFKNGRFHLVGAWTDLSCIYKNNNNSTDACDGFKDFELQDQVLKGKEQDLKTQRSKSKEQTQEYSSAQYKDTDDRGISKADKSSRTMQNPGSNEITPDMLDDAAYIYASLSERYPYVTPEYALSIIVGIHNLKYTYESKFIRIAVSQALNAEIRKTVGDYIIGTVRTICENYRMIRGEFAETIKARSTQISTPESNVPQPKPAENQGEEEVGKDITNRFCKLFEGYMKSKQNPKDGNYGTVKLGQCKVYQKSDEVVIHSFLYEDDNLHTLHWNSAYRQAAIEDCLQKLGIQAKYKVENKAKEIKVRNLISKIQEKQKTPAYAEVAVSAV